jgi:uncharacterized phiE125 gp8 family phage protein
MTMIVQRALIATGSPFRLVDVAAHCRVTAAGIDEELSRLASAAANELEAYAQLALLMQTITVTLESGPPRSWFELPVAPLLDPLSVAVTVDGLAYEAFAVVAGLRPAVRFTSAKPCGLVVITYDAGFGTAASDVPPDLSNAISDQAAAYFFMRGEADGKSNGMSPHMARVAARYRRVSL